MEINKQKNMKKNICKHAYLKAQTKHNTKLKDSYFDLKGKF